MKIFITCMDCGKQRVHGGYTSTDKFERSAMKEGWMLYVSRWRCPACTAAFRKKHKLYFPHTGKRK